MDIDRIIQSKLNRQSREGKPFNILYDSFRELISASNHILEDSSFPYSHLLERSISITAVTAIETYYKDILDIIFRICDPDFFKPVLKEIHKSKYDINELILMHEKSIHPLELIAANQSFQSIETIDSIFSKFLKKSLWGKIIGMQVRIKDNPDSVSAFEASNLEDLRKIFNIRHELVHNPNSKEKIITEEFVILLQTSRYMVFGSNMVITEMINANMDNGLITNEKQP
jgi:hypothetical protein